MCCYESMYAYQDNQQSRPHDSNNKLNIYLMYAVYASPGFLYLLNALCLASSCLTTGRGYPSLSATAAGGLCKSKTRTQAQPTNSPPPIKYNAHQVPSAWPTPERSAL